MTNFEFNNNAARLLSKHKAEGIRRTHIQHEHERHFGDGRKAQAELSKDAAGSGWLSREGVDNDPNDVSQGITDAAGYIEKAINATGDDGLADGLRSVLATLNALAKVPNGSLVPKAKPNRNGSTEDSRFVPSNKVNSAGSSDRWASIADLSDSPPLMRLLKKYPKIAEQFVANE